jgi:hypothetical protein
VVVLHSLEQFLGRGVSFHAGQCRVDALALAGAAEAVALKDGADGLSG